MDRTEIDMGQKRSFLPLEYSVHASIGIQLQSASLPELDVGSGQSSVSFTSQKPGCAHY
jgi:hypothetical protein